MRFYNKSISLAWARFDALSITLRCIYKNMYTWWDNILMPFDIVDVCKCFESLLIGLTATTTISKWVLRLIGQTNIEWTSNHHHREACYPYSHRTTLGLMREWDRFLSPSSFLFNIIFSSINAPRRMWMFIVLPCEYMVELLCGNVFLAYFDQ